MASAQQKQNPLKSILAVLLLVGVGVAFWFIYQTFSDKPVTGFKTITVSIGHTAESIDKTLTIQTEAAHLGEALEQEGLVAGKVGPTGIYITTVDGILADESKQEYWCFYKSGEMLTTGADSTPIADGDQFEIILTNW